LAANVTWKTLGNHVSCECLLEFFSRVQLFKELVIFADCCRTRVGGDVQRRPPYWSYSDLTNGSVCKFMGCAAIYGQQSFEETDLAPDERRGYFTRALIAGLRGEPGAIDPITRRITATSLSEYISEHMRSASMGKFRNPLEADFLTEGPTILDFGSTSGLASARAYRVTIEIRSRSVGSLNIRDNLGAHVCVAHPVSVDPIVFECSLSSGLYEAVPDGAVVTLPLKPWLFKVSDRSIHEQF
jgi:hypothetical protein